ncbi:MAG: serine/threonine protein kinase [Archangiaceae bacterium]|nr:serine/threonine protein kinase [Archangiaceae bacterium]
MEQLGRYQLERKLAAGGMAEVFLARQLGPGGFARTCVVKRMLPQLSEDVTFVEMFLDEARVAARLQHQNIAQIYDFGHERGSYYLAMEYVPGENLKVVIESRLKAGRHIDLPVAAKVTALVAHALDYAHHASDEKGRPLQIIHRDVSPQNVMISTAGEVKLIDFGIAKAATDSHRTVAGTLKGKWAYMSPEQLRHQKVDQRTDLYALGLVLYELLALKPAVPASDNVNELMLAAVERQYAPIERLRPDTPKTLRLVLERALKVSPGERYQSARELADALEDWLEQVGETAGPGQLAELLDDPSRLTTEPTGSQPVRRVKGQGTVREVQRPDDPSFAETPLMGTPPVSRKGVEPDLSLVPTEPERVGPDIDAVMKLSRDTLGRSPREAPTAQARPRNVGSRDELKSRPPTGEGTPTDPEPGSATVTEPSGRARLWPYVTVVVLLAAVAFGLAVLLLLRKH